MLGKFRAVGGVRTGEYYMATGAGSYVGGTPAKMTAYGTVDAISGSTPDSSVDATGGTTSQTAYLGVFANCYGYDVGQGVDYVWASTGTGRTVSSKYNCTVIQGTFRVRLQAGTKTISANAYYDGYPYATADSWDEANLLYISTAGLWTNTPPSSGATPRGIVEAVGTDYLDVYFW